MNRFKANIAALVLLSSFIFGCAYNKVEYASSTASTETKEDTGFSTQVVWLKNKQDKMDIFVRFKNNYTHPIFVKETSFKIDMSGIAGEPRNNMGYMELMPGQSVERVMVFYFPTEVPKLGTATLSVSPIQQGTLESLGKALPALKIELPITQ